MSVTTDVSTPIRASTRGSVGVEAVQREPIVRHVVRLIVLIGLGISIAWQAALAGQFLSGQAWALGLHETGAYAVVLFGIGALIVEIVSRRWGSVALAALLEVAIVAQLLLGFASVRQSAILALHVPLGVSIAALYVYYLTVGLRR